MLLIKLVPNAIQMLATSLEPRLSVPDLSCSFGEKLASYKLVVNGELSCHAVTQNGVIGAHASWCDIFQLKKCQRLFQN